MKSYIFLFAFVVFAQCDSHKKSGDHHDSDEHSRDENHFDYQRIKKLAEDSARNFNPGFVRSFHSARLYSIRNYNMYDTLVTLRKQTMPLIKRMAGEVPARNSKGEFQVVFLNERDTVYQYRMESPLNVRRENGADNGLFKVRAGSFFIPLPEVKNVTEIVLRDNDGTELVSKFR